MQLLKNLPRDCQNMSDDLAGLLGSPVLVSHIVTRIHPIARLWNSPTSIFGVFRVFSAWRRWRQGRWAENPFLRRSKAWHCCRAWLFQTRAELPTGSPEAWNRTTLTDLPDRGDWPEQERATCRKHRQLMPTEAVDCGRKRPGNRGLRFRTGKLPTVSLGRIEPLKVPRRVPPGLTAAACPRHGPAPAAH